MTNRTAKIIVAFLAGQVVQVVLHSVAMSCGMWDSKRISFCIAGGVLTLVILISGVLISGEGAEKIPEDEMTYLDYAKVPEKREEVLDLFGKRKD